MKKLLIHFASKKAIAPDSLLKYKKKSVKAVAYKLKNNTPFKSVIKKFLLLIPAAFFVNILLMFILKPGITDRTSYGYFFAAIQTIIFNGGRFRN